MYPKVSQHENCPIHTNKSRGPPNLSLTRTKSPSDSPRRTQRLRLLAKWSRALTGEMIPPSRSYRSYMYARLRQSGTHLGVDSLAKTKMHHIGTGPIFIAHVPAKHDYMRMLVGNTRTKLWLLDKVAVLVVIEEIPIYPMCG